MARQSNDGSPSLQHNESVAAIVAALPNSLSDDHRQQLIVFIEAYFEGFSELEFRELSAEDFAGIALSHWQLAKDLKPRESKHRIFNPSFELQGWHTLHTVIQIVVEDQPWLVSSLQSTLAREGHVAHRLIHPVLRVNRNPDHVYQGLGENGKNESLIHIEIDALPEEAHAKLTDSLTQMFETGE